MKRSNKIILSSGIVIVLLAGAFGTHEILLKNANHEVKQAKESLDVQKDKLSKVQSELNKYQHSASSNLCGSFPATHFQSKKEVVLPIEQNYKMDTTKVAQYIANYMTELRKLNNINETVTWNEKSAEQDFVKRVAAAFSDPNQVIQIADPNNYSFAGYSGIISGSKPSAGTTESDQETAYDIVMNLYDQSGEESAAQNTGADPYSRAYMLYSGKTIGVDAANGMIAFDYEPSKGKQDRPASLKAVPLPDITFDYVNPELWEKANDKVKQAHNEVDKDQASVDKAEAKVKSFKHNLLRVTFALSAFVAVGVVASQVSANTRVYEIRDRAGENFMLTASSYEKSVNISKNGWKDTGISWIAPSQSNTPVYRLYNPHSGEHFYTSGSYEKQVLIRAGWHYEGISFYSASSTNNQPVYRLYKTGHRYTTSLSEVNSLKAAGWKLDGSRFYAIYPTENWSYNAKYYTYSAVVNDIQYPQFNYLTSSGSAVAGYQNNNQYAAYNNAVYNFNSSLAQVASNADYANWQARKTWANELNDFNMVINQAQTTVNADQAQVNQYQTLVNQQLTYISEDQKEKRSTASDQNLLNQYQGNLNTAKSNLTTANQTYQSAVNKRDAFQKAGTDNVKLSYTISRSADNKSVTVHFTQTTQKDGELSSKTSSLVAYLAF